jgi:phosphopentomutase
LASSQINTGETIMKRTAKLALATVAALGLAAVALPVVADQAHHAAQAGGGMGAGTPMSAGAGMPGGAMMGAAQTNVMAMFDTNKDGTLSPEEMTAGIKAVVPREVV